MIIPVAARAHVVAAGELPDHYSVLSNKNLKIYAFIVLEIKFETDVITTFNDTKTFSKEVPESNL